MAVGLVAARSAVAETITVYSKMAGAGAVGVVNGPGGIACRTDGAANCVGTVVAGAQTLTAADVQNATFVGWSGCTSVSGATCNLTVSGTNKIVTANFKPTSFTLNLKTYGNGGNGSLVTAGTSPLGSCQTGALAPLDLCSVAVANGGAVTITATPDAGMKVASWSGCTAVDATSCTIPAVTSSRLVTATFGPVGFFVTAQISGAGAINAAAGGDVIDGMACPGDCQAQVAPGKAIVLTAVPASGAKFIGWTGCTTASGTSCTITNVTAATAITATFKAASCGACHPYPPTSHVASAWTQDCGACHGAGYGYSSVNATTHMDGVANAPAPAPAPAPAGFGFNIQILAAATTNGAATPKPYVDVLATDAAGAVIALPTALTGAASGLGEFAYVEPGGRIGNRSPRYAFGEIQTDGSFLAKLGTTKVATSETGLSSQYVLLDPNTYGPGGTTLPGVYRYTFSNSLGRTPQDLTRTYRVVVYGARFFKPASGEPVMFANSNYFDFVPAGGTATTTAKEDVNDVACNACHGKITLHGMRRGVAVCLTCHNPNTPLGNVSTTITAAGVSSSVATTDGFRWELKNLVHKLHSGKSYGSWVKDAAGAIIGVTQPTKPDGTTGTGWFTITTDNRTTPATVTYSVAMDASEIKMAPSHSTYFEGASLPAGVAVHDTPLQTQCFVCHQGANAANAFSRPSRNSCGSCHDNVNFATGVGHNGGIAQLDDAICSACHPASGAQNAAQYPVATVHSRFYEPVTKTDFARAVTFNGTSYAAVPSAGHDLQVTIDNVSITAAGVPAVDFTVKLDGAPYATMNEGLTAAINSATTSTDVLGGRFATCAFIFAGPTSDYTFPTTGSAQLSCTSGSAPSQVVKVTARNAALGQYSLTTTTAVLAGKTGTYTVAYEMMWQRQAGSAAAGIVRKPFAANPKFYVVSRADTASAWTFLGEEGTGARRKVVAFAKCNNCHVDLGFHSNRGRKGPDYCAACHNPKLDNGTRARVTVAEAVIIPGTSETGYLPESVSMNVFIHRIHMGADLPSVQAPANASPLSILPGRIAYGATRSAFVGLDASTPPDISDFSAFAMPNPMGRCNQCHLAAGEQGAAADTWKLNEGAGLAPIERTYRLCTSATPTWATEPWCNITSTSGPAKRTTVATPPLKAVCTSCHDSAATNAHVDLNTTNPMTAGATELCASCHGAGKAWDSLAVHPAIP